MVLVIVVVAGVIAFAVAVVGAFAVRRRFVQRPGGTFDCSLRLLPVVRAASSAQEAASAAASSGSSVPEGAASDSPGSSSDSPSGDASDGRADDGAALPASVDHGKGWVFGIARYSGDRIEWFRVFSYSPRPRRVLERHDIVVVQRRLPVGHEELALLAGAVVLVCSHRGRLLELAMSEDALTGFLAWLEAAPPGQRVNVA